MITLYQVYPVAKREEKPVIVSTKSEALALADNWYSCDDDDDENTKAELVITKQENTVDVYSITFEPTTVNVVELLNNDLIFLSLESESKATTKSKNVLRRFIIELTASF